MTDFLTAIDFQEIRRTLDEGDLTRNMVIELYEHACALEDLLDQADETCAFGTRGWRAYAGIAEENLRNE